MCPRSPGDPRWSDEHPFPLLDVIELAGTYLVQAELAGVKPEEVAVRVLNDRLMITVERRPDYPDGVRRVLRMELAYGIFQREILLPADADAERITAAWSAGLLRVTIPRRGPRHTRIGIEIE